jgi:hypothetical protein
MPSDASDREEQLVLFTMDVFTVRLASDLSIVSRGAAVTGRDSERGMGFDC